MPRPTRCARCREPAVAGATHCLRCNSALGSGPFVTRRMWTWILAAVIAFSVFDTLNLLNERKLGHRRAAEAEQVAAELRGALMGADAPTLRKLRDRVRALERDYPRILPAEAVERVEIRGGRTSELVYDDTGRPLKEPRKLVRYFWKALLLRGGEWYEVTGTLTKPRAKDRPEGLMIHGGPDSLIHIGQTLPPVSPG